MRFDFPQRAAKLAFDRWGDLPFAPGYQPTPRPPRPALAALLNTCFFASLRREGTKGLYLWGLANVDPRSGTTSDLEELRVRVLGPGEMKITLHGRVLCTYKSGRIREPERALINTGCIYDFFRETSFLLCREVKAATGHPAGDEPVHERDEWAIAYLLRLQDLIERMQQLGHGGCILVVPDASYQNSTYITIKYRCRDDTIWNCLRGSLILSHQFYARRLSDGVNRSHPEELVDVQFEMKDVENGLRDSLAAPVRLTAVDGAVLMTRKFELLGFGTVVKLPQEAKYKVFSCQDRRASQPKRVPLEKYGTRHRSAFEFCYLCPNSVAIVASQDGGLKLVTRVGSHVHFWENSPFDWTAEEEPWGR